MTTDNLRPAAPTPEIQAELQALQAVLQDTSNAVAALHEKLGPVMDMRTAVNIEIEQTNQPVTALGKYVATLRAQAISTLASIRLATDSISF
jgi:histidinol dehydrogenase